MFARKLSDPVSTSVGNGAHLTDSPSILQKMARAVYRLHVERVDESLRKSLSLRSIQPGSRVSVAGGRGVSAAVQLKK